MIARRTRSTLSLSRFLLIVMGIVLLYLVASFVRQVAISHQAARELEQIEARQTAAAQENERLNAYLVYARSNPAVEKWARDQGWAKAGEVPVVVVAPRSQATPAPAGPAPAASPASYRQAWWELFFGTR